MKRIILLIFIFLASCTSLNGKGKEIRDDPAENTKTVNTPGLIKGTSTLNNVDMQMIEFDPREWNLIYGKEPIRKVAVRSKGPIWLLTARGSLLFSQNRAEWVVFEKDDFGIPDLLNDIVLASDNSVWIAGRKSIAHYTEGEWRVYTIPNTTDKSFTRITTDPLNDVWIATPLCNCEKSIKEFDGQEWKEFSPKKKVTETSQIIFDFQGNLWASFGWPEGIGRYDGVEWKFFLGTEFWPSGPFQPIRIAVGRDSVIWAVLENQKSIITLDNSGITKEIYFDPNLRIESHLLRTYVDENNNLWINAFLINSSGAKVNSTGLAFFDGSYWNSFSDLPFSQVSDITGDDTGSLYISTEKGVYKYK